MPKVAPYPGYDGVSQTPAPVEGWSTGDGR